MKISQAQSPLGALSSIQRLPSTLAPRSLKASRWASRRRRPMKSPPGGGIFASPKRASSGPASRNEARILPESSSSTLAGDLAGAEPDAVVGDPRDLDPELLEQGDLGFGVADPRHPVQQHLLLGQQAGGEDRQRRVLVAGDGRAPRRGARRPGSRTSPSVCSLRAHRARVTTGHEETVEDRRSASWRRCSCCSSSTRCCVDGEDRERRASPSPAAASSTCPDGEMQVRERGPRSGSPIVLIHCFSCAINWWDGMMPMLERNHRVIAVDLLGHGGSEKPGSGYTPPNQAQVVGEALERLRVEDAEVVGHSLGGAVTVALAQEHPQLVGRAVIIDMPPDNSYGDLGFIAGLAFQPVLGEALWRIKPDFSIRDGPRRRLRPRLRRPRRLRRGRQADDLHRLRRIAQRRRRLPRRRVARPADEGSRQAADGPDGRRRADRQRPAAGAGPVQGAPCPAPRPT